jgi:hypothetical protein
MRGEGGVSGSQPMSTAVHMSPINFGDLTPFVTRGGNQERNPDKSLKSFPRCYSQLSLLTDCTPLPRFLGLEISTALP